MVPFARVQTVEKTCTGKVKCMGTAVGPGARPHACFVEEDNDCRNEGGEETKRTVLNTQRHGLTHEEIEERSRDGRTPGGIGRRWGVERRALPG